MKLVDSNRRPLDPKFDVVPLSHRAPRINVFGSLCYSPKHRSYITVSSIHSLNDTRYQPGRCKRERKVFV